MYSTTSPAEFEFFNDPQVIDGEIIISTFNLGQWTDSGLVNGEAEKWIGVFKDWVKTQKWWNSVHLILRPRKNKWIDFVLKIK